jgi:hypothetical protein
LTLLRFFVLTLSAASTLTACAAAKTPENAANGGVSSACGKLDDEDCAKVRGMLSAMDSFSSIHEELVLDTRSTLAPSCGIAAHIDSNAIDFSYVGVAIDDAIVDGASPISRVVRAGDEARLYTVRLFALALATHSVGAVKYGGMLSYETTVKGAELKGGTVLDVVKAKLLASDADVREVTVGGLEVTGLDEARPRDFNVKNPVPIAHAVHATSDGCR